MLRLNSLKTFLFAAVVGVSLSACGDDGDAGGTSNTLGETSSTTGDTGGEVESDTTVEDTEVDPSDSDSDSASDICLLQNCEDDLECAGCTEGRTMCYAPDKRCVACDPESGEGCEEGLRCTEFGDCVDADLECPTDEEGVPTFECNDDPDCAACDPDHQVCAAGQCVQCRGDALDACQSTEACIGNVCVSKCPESCTTNEECSDCGTKNAPATACHNHTCAECSNSSSTPVACPNGEFCTDEGACAPLCGIPGQSPGVCESDDDCAGCRADNTNCIIPINADRGTCGPVASGCSDLGEGVAVLPEPYDQITNLCSDDPDCEGIGIQYNVGELLRDLTGIDEIDDANIFYPMAACADITVGVGNTSISCGVCVPCEENDDCNDIDIDQVAGDAFGPLGPIAAALLLDTLFGDNEHMIFMSCQPIAAGYGVCVPCPNLLNDCTDSGGSGGGSCDHDVNTEGGPLDPSCGTCAAAVCEQDGFCCNTAWDEQCVNSVDIHCTDGACHDQCEVGEAMNPSCNQCVADICEADSWCCENEWDDLCVSRVADICNGECVGEGCAHSECTLGGALPSDCSSCATDVCNIDSICCDSEWDLWCVAEAETLCAGCNHSCDHNPCSTGAALDEDCGACAEVVCGLMPECCNNSWSASCVTQAETSCGC